MSFIEDVLKPVRFPWQHAQVLVAKAAAAEPPDMPSLASVEYELGQLRVDLSKVVDFGSQTGKGRAIKAAPAQAPGAGLTRSDAHRRRLMAAMA